MFMGNESSVNVTEEALTVVEAAEDTLDAKIGDFAATSRAMVAMNSTNAEM